MSTAPAEPTPAGLDALVEGCQRMLMALSEKGVALAGALDPHDRSVPVGELALAYSRLSRAVRLNILLCQRLDALARGGLCALIAERERSAAAPDTEAADPADPADADPADPRERLERPDREAPDEALRLIKRPLPEVVAAICQGYGLTPEETEEAQAPFAALLANDDTPPDPPPGRQADASYSGPLRDSSALRPRHGLKARLLAGTARTRKLGP